MITTDRVTDFTLRDYFPFFISSVGGEIINM